MLSNVCDGTLAEHLVDSGPSLPPIRPGQIFGLPKDVLPNAEELHRKRLSGQHL